MRPPQYVLVHLRWRLIILNACFNNHRCPGRVGDKIGLGYLRAIMWHVLVKNRMLTLQRDCHLQSRLPGL